MNRIDADRLPLNVDPTVVEPLYCEWGAHYTAALVEREAGHRHTLCPACDTEAVCAVCKVTFKEYHATLTSDEAGASILVCETCAAIPDPEEEYWLAREREQAQYETARYGAGN